MLPNAVCAFADAAGSTIRTRDAATFRIKHKSVFTEESQGFVEAIPGQCPANFKSCAVII